MNIKTKYLSNQLPLFYLKTQKAPVVTMQVWVKTGSADELNHEAGLSHFIEHLVFKGTQSFAPGDIAKVVEGAGGELNAYTSFDQTVFYVTVPKENIEVAAQVLHEMVTSPQFNPLEVDREREVVIEEIKRGFDQPSRVASQFLFNHAFKGYSYEFPVIGTEENIRRVPVEEIKDYFDERYCVPNMSLVCVGDVEESEVETLAEKYFSKVQKEPRLKRERKRGQVKLEDQNIFYKSTDFEKTFFYYTWKAENLLHEKSDVYEVLSLLLGQGESSHLYKELKLEKGLCQSIGCFYYAGKDEGVFAISGTTMPEKFEELSQALSHSVRDFMKLENLDGALQKARNIFASEQYYAQESISSLCRQIGDDWLYYNDVDQTAKKLQIIKNIDVEKCRKVLTELFIREPRLVYVSKEKADQTQLEQSMKDMKSLNEQNICWVSSDKNTEDFETQREPVVETERVWKTEKGNTIVYLPQKESEVCSVKLGLAGGEAFANENKQGLVSLFGRVWGRESKDFTEASQNLLLDHFCSSFGAFSGKHSIGLSMMTLNKFFGELKDIFLSSFGAPVFNANILDREKEILLAQLKSRKDHPASELFKNFSESIFKGSLYARDSIGKEEDIQKISIQDLETFYNDHKGPFILTLVGNLSEEVLEDFVISLEKLQGETKEFDLNQVPFETQSSGEVSSVPSEKAQTHIFLGYKGLRFADDRKITLDIVNSILGGQGGRLFIELRDKESLAYSVAPVDYAGFFAGYFGAYIACDPSKKEKAISMMQAELKKLCDEPISAEEIQFAKNQTLGRRAMSLQKNSFIADTCLFDALYGLEPLSYREYNEKIQSVAEEDIKKLMKEILGGDEYLFSVG